MSVQRGSADILPGTLGKALPYSRYRTQPWGAWAKGYKGSGFCWDMNDQLSPRDGVYAYCYLGSVDDGKVLLVSVRTRKQLLWLG